MTLHILYEGNGVMKNKIKILMTVALLINAVVCSYSYAGVPAPEKKRGIEERNVSKKDSFVGHKSWTKQDLLKLKQDDPERFNALVGEWKKKIYKQLMYIKQTDPQRYNRIVQSLSRKRLQNLAKLRKDEPGKFKELIKNRHKAIKQRIERMKYENPEEYQCVINYARKLRQLNQMRKENPKEFQKFLEEHPVLRKRLMRLQYGL